MKIPQEIRTLIEQGTAVHLTTLNRDGSPQVTVIWVAVDDDEIIAGHFTDHRKLKNIRRDPRVALSLTAPSRNSTGLQEYAVLYGEARVEEGGAPALIRRLADIYIAPGSEFPPPGMPQGYTMRVRIDRITGVGPWARPRKSVSGSDEY